MPPEAGLSSSEVVQVLVTVALCLLMGLEREEKRAADRTYIIGGVRTFPIVGLIGYAITLLSPDSFVAPIVGFAALSSLLVVSYLHKLRDADHGATTEVSVMATYLVGALVAREHLWVATSVTVASVLLLHARAPLRQFAVRLPRQEVSTLVQFILLAAVILPVLPNAEFTRFNLNPFKAWLIVVAVSGISYASYLVQRVLRRPTVLLTGLLGGTYSSTATTVVLARHSKDAGAPRLHAGAIILASSVMYLRVAVLLIIFNAALGCALSARLAVLAAVGALSGYLMARSGAAPAAPQPQLGEHEARNPLEVWTALIFALLFVIITVLTRLATQYLGDAGVYAFAAIAGTVDVDPFILSMTQTVGAAGGPSVHVGAVAVIIAAAVNNVLKGIYALAFGNREVGALAFVGIASLGVLSLLALIGL